MGGARRQRSSALAAHPHAVAGAVLGACVFAYLWPVLVGGEILSPIAALYHYPPWQQLTPSDLDDYYNPLLLDLPVVDYPWRVLVRDLLREGTLPAWNGYVLTGIPLYSNSQTGLFSPFNVPLWTLPLTYGLGVSAALKLFGGGFGTYLLARQLRLGLLPGLLAGVAFPFAAINIVWLAHETLPGVVVMLPWALWLVERIFERGRPGSAIALAAAIAVGLGGGHPGMQVHLIVVTATYALIRAACTGGARKDEAPALPRALALVGGGLVAGTLLMAFMLIPEAYSAHDTVGVAARQAQELPGARLPLDALRTVAFPDWWGRPTGAWATADEGNAAVLFTNFNERTFYAGTVALLLAVAGLLCGGRLRRKLPFALIALLGLAVALRAPGLHWLVHHLPVLELVESQRLHLAFALGIPILGAFGLQALLDGAIPKRAAIGISLVALLLGAVALIATRPSGDAVGDTLRHFLDGTDFADNDVLASTAIAWYLLFAVGTGAALLLAWRRPRWRTGLAIGLVALAAADAYHFVRGFQPMAPESSVIPPRTPAIDYLVQHRDEGRFVGLGDTLPPDWALVYGLRDVRGYDPPQPTTRMLGLWRVMTPDQVGWKPMSVNALEPRQVGVLSLMGVRWVIAPPGTEIPAASARALRVVHEGEDATVLENAAAAPRALVPRRVAIAANAAAARRTIGDAGLDAPATAVLEAGEPGVTALADETGEVAGARGTVAIAAERNASVTLDARLERGGLVVLNDQLTEGWSVYVDGRPATPLRVDTVMRGVIVPAGRHVVEWRYRVPGLRLGALVSLFTLVALTGTAVVLRRRARNARR